MHPLIPGLEVELKATARFQREAKHLLKKLWVHGAVSLPANAEDVTPSPLPGQARNPNRVGKLRRGVATEETNAGGGLVHSRGKLRGGNLRLIGACSSKMPVLTEETVKRAGLVEDRQIFVAVLWTSLVGEEGIAGPGSTWADPVSDTIGGEGIIIPTQVPLCGCGSQKLAVLHPARSAEASFTLRDLALIDTDSAGKSGASGRS